MNPVHIDVIQKGQSLDSVDRITEMVEEFLRSLVCLRHGTILQESHLANSALRDHVECIAVCDTLYVGEPLRNTPFIMHVHKLKTTAAQRIGGDIPSIPKRLAACDVLSLPHKVLAGLWEAMVFDSQIKADLLRFALTVCDIEARKYVNSRSVLLHGPPGCGKTSLCRALAYKLSVRLSSSYQHFVLLEIKPQDCSLEQFTNLIDHIKDMLNNMNMMIILFVDEVESLLYTRRTATKAPEPSESVHTRVVLAALDRLLRRPNVLLLTTSSSDTLDPAFLDRIDFKRCLPLPGHRAAYTILHTACKKLIEYGVVDRAELLPLQVLEKTGFVAVECTLASLELMLVAGKASNARMSVRALRRLPVLTLSENKPSQPALSLQLCAFLQAMHITVDNYIRDQSALAN